MESRRRRAIDVLPSLVTLLNAACGVVAVLFAAEALRLDDDKLLGASAWLVFLGMLFDGLDGRIARMTQRTSDFGAQLDTLADLVTFGVAPVIILRSLVLMEAAHYEMTIHPRLLVAAPAAYTLCAILRLARFHSSQSADEIETERTGFVGLPTPAAASIPCGMVLLFFALRSPDFAFPVSPVTLSVWHPVMLWLSPFVMALVGALMVSRVRYPHLGSWLLRERRPFPFLVEVMFTLVLIALEPELMLFASGVLFAVGGLVYFSVRLIFPARERASA